MKGAHELNKHIEMIAALVSGLLTGIAWWAQSDWANVSVALFLSAYVIGGFASAKEGLVTLVKEREFDVNLLMVLAAIGAASIGYWMEGALLIFIFALSGALETYTLAKSERDLTALMKLQPETAYLYDADGQETVVAVDTLQAGQQIIIRPGERIPADGQIIEGRSSVDQSMMTGESIPVERTVGEEVLAGTMNVGGLLIVEVSRSNAQSVFAKIVKLIEQTRNAVPKSQQWMERFEKRYAMTVLVITLLLMFVPHYLLGWSWSDTLYRAMIFLVVASPCALVASIMPALLSAISRSARKGVLFKSGMHLSMLSDVKMVVFDKTGTLTMGTPKVADIITWHGYAQAQLLQAVASVESGSNHPLAKAIVGHAKAQNLPVQRPDNFESLTGMGIAAVYQGRAWRVGKPKMFELSKQEQIIVRNLQQQGKTVVVAACAGQVVGLITLQDQLRPETKATIDYLKQQGIRTAMLTGDHAHTAERLGRQAGVDFVYSERLPQEKVQVVEELTDKYGKVVMIGDGVNDAPALTRAPIGIAMGGIGSDVALETADIVLMQDDLNRIPMLIRTSQKLQSVVKQNIVFALAVIGLLISANFFQIMTLPLGVIGHEGSTLLVILNGLRMLR